MPRPSHDVGIGHGGAELTTFFSLALAVFDHGLSALLVMEDRRQVIDSSCMPSPRGARITLAVGRRTEPAPTFGAGGVL
jgi:hypothetical protein